MISYSFYNTLDNLMTEFRQYVNGSAILMNGNGRINGLVLRNISRAGNFEVIFSWYQR